MEAPQPPEKNVFKEYRKNSFGPLTMWQDDRWWAVAPDGRFASVPFFAKLAETKQAFVEGVVVEFGGAPAMRMVQPSKGFWRSDRRVFLESLLPGFVPEGAYLVLSGFFGSVKMATVQGDLLKAPGRTIKMYPPATDDLAIAFAVAIVAAHPVLQWGP